MGVSHWQLIAFAVVLLLLFGNRLPSVMRSLGRSVVEFKKGVQGEGEDEEDNNSKKSSEKDK
ncbi:MAG: twin-arginine translocase TatA/TatE family subunit [Planctomycetaceae bacterium]|nr:twin-arginine translocase TatA/TatE family subunit [Planctomycetaceae bacterium]